MANKTSKANLVSAKGSITLPCSCKSVFQDAAYGKNLRLHTVVVAKNGIGRCTVCGVKK